MANRRKNFLHPPGFFARQRNAYYGPGVFKLEKKFAQLLPAITEFRDKGAKLIEMVMKEREEHKQEGNLAHLEALKKKLEGINLEFPVKTSVRGEIFSSVTEHDIERSLAAHGVRPAKAVLQKPLRMLGGHEARIEFGYGVTGTIKITLKPTKEE